MNTSSGVREAYILWLLIIGLPLSSQNFPVKLPSTPLTVDFETSEFDAGIQNLSFDQDSSQTLFVANNFGLLVFDGQSWEFYPVPNSTKIRAIYIDNLDRIYVGGQGQIGFFEQGTSGLEFTSLLNLLPFQERSISEVWNIYGHNEAIYFQTIDQLFQLKDDQIRRLEFPGKPINSFPVGEQVIVQIENQGLFALQEGRTDFLRGTETISSQVNGIIPNGDGFLVFEMDGRISKFQTGRLEPVLNRYESILKAGLVNVAIELSDGTLAVGTQNDGLFMFNQEFELIRHLTKNKGLNHRTVYSLYEDHRGMLWVGLNNGITYVEMNSPLTLINEDFGLEGTGYTAIRQNDKVYLGTSSGLFYYETGNNDRFKLVPNSLGQAYNLSEINNTIYLSHNEGIFELKDDLLIKIYDRTGAWKLEKTHLNNHILAGTYDGLVRIGGSGKEKSFVEMKGDFAESSRVFEFENDSTLWVSHGYKGAYRLSLSNDLTEIKNTEVFGADDGFPSDILISVYKLNGQLVFTSERGIYQFDDLKRSFKKNQFLNDALGEQHVSKISQDSNGNIYFIAGNEIGLLQQNGFENYTKISDEFERVNTHLSNDLENITILDSRNVLIGAKEGFIHYDPSMEFSDDQQLTVNFHPVEITTQKDSTFSINPTYFSIQRLESVASVKFRFASPHFDPYEDVEFSYRLSPFESNWSAWSYEGYKEYTNLQAGGYTFEVKARSNSKNESTSKQLTFEIIPVWYKSRWVSFGFLGFLLFSAGFIYYKQAKKYKWEREEIFSQKEIELKERDEKIDEISLKSAEKIEQLKSEKLRAEIEYKNSQLAAITMHLLNKNEFVQNVRKKINELTKNRNGISADLKKIIKNIDQNLSEDDSWDQFASHFDQVHGDFFKKLAQMEFKLTPQETKLAAYLRMNMSSKEIANLMNISVRGVELARYRLRKKIQLDREQNLVEFLMSV